MKRIKLLAAFRISRLAGTVALAAAGCGYDGHEPPPADYAAATATVTIAELKSLSQDGAPVAIGHDLTIAGTVTASDASGNFFRSFVVQDGTGAVEVMAGLYDLHVLYPVGRRVSVALGGLTLARTDAVCRLGYAALPSGGHAVDYIAHPALVGRHVGRGVMERPPEPLVVTPGGMDQSMAGLLVVVRAMTLRGGGTATWATVAAESYTGYPLSKEVIAENGAGGRVYVHTSGYADFAGEVIPAGRVSLIGILSLHDGHWRLRLRDLDDVRNEE